MLGSSISFGGFGAKLKRVQVSLVQRGTLLVRVSDGHVVLCQKPPEALIVPSAPNTQCQGSYPRDRRVEGWRQNQRYLGYPGAATPPYMLTLPAGIERMALGTLHSARRSHFGYRLCRANSGRELAFSLSDCSFAQVFS